MALLRFLSAFPERPDDARQALESTPPETLLAQGRLHGMSALVQYALGVCGATLPPEHAERLAGDAVRSAGATLRAKMATVAALDALAQAQLTPVLLKGYALGARIYPEPLFRPTTDVDLLVAESEVETAGEALRAIGLSPMAAPAEAYHRAHHHHVVFAGARGTVELHFRLMTGFGAELRGEDALSRAQAFTLDGRSARILALEDEVLYLAAHAANHLFSRLAWLYDLKLILAREQPSWDRVAQAARATHLQAPVGTAFALAKRIHAKLPDAVMGIFALSPWHAWIERHVFTDARLEAPPWNHRKWSTFAMTTLMASTPSALLRYAGHQTARGLRHRFARTFPNRAPASWRA